MNVSSSQRPRNLRIWFVITSLLLLLPPAGVRATPEIASQEGPTILIWKVGSPHRGDLPKAVVPDELQNEAAKLGFRLEIKAFPAQGFADRYFRAWAINEEPDVLAIDNWGLIEGIRTNLGVFQGIGSERKIRDSLVKVSQSLTSLFPQGGWQLLMTSSRNYAAARALALRELKCDSAIESPIPQNDGGPGKDITTTSESAVQAFFNNDTNTLNGLAGGKYPDGALSFTRYPDGSLGPTSQGTVRQIKTCGMWGNQRLAFVNTLVSVERGPVIGHQHLVTILSKTNATWQLLHLYEYTDLIKELRNSQANFLQDGPPLSLQKATWISPPEQTSFLRFPVDQRPMLEWTRAADSKVIYLVETQIRDRDWFQNRFKLVSNPNDEATIKLQAPHGVGMQPHRIRVWAIDQTGDITVSDWRVINFRN